MIPSKNRDARCTQMWGDALLDQARLQGDGLKFTEAAQRLGTRIDALLDGRREFAGEWLDVECGCHEAGSG
jgi:hypothetical protein